MYVILCHKATTTIYKFEIHYFIHCYSQYKLLPCFWWAHLTRRWTSPDRSRYGRLQSDHVAAKSPRSMQWINKLQILPKHWKSFWNAYLTSEGFHKPGTANDSSKSAPHNSFSWIFPLPRQLWISPGIQLGIMAFDEPFVSCRYEFR